MVKSALCNKILDEIKKAMKSGDTTRRDCLRMVVSELKNQTVNAGKEMTDDACIKVLQKAVKTRNDSISQFKAAGRNDLAEKEQIEARVLEEFLPKMMSEDETKALVESTLKELGLASKKDMGRAMKEVLGKACGRADGKLVSKLVAAVLK